MAGLSAPAFTITTNGSTGILQAVGKILFVGIILVLAVASGGSQDAPGRFSRFHGEDALLACLGQFSSRLQQQLRPVCSSFRSVSVPWPLAIRIAAPPSDPPVPLFSLESNMPVHRLSATTKP